MAAALTSVAALAGQVEVHVEVGQGPPVQVKALLSEILSDAPYSVRAERGRAVLILTDKIGLDRLSADSRLSVVEQVGGEPPVARAETSAAGPITEWTVKLKTSGLQRSAARPLNADGDQQALHSAEIVSRRDAEADGLPSQSAGPGTLVVRGLDIDGLEVARAVVNDPRLIRSESVGANGRLTGRQDFLRADAIFTVELPADPRIVALEVGVPSGNSQSARVLATALAR